MRKILFALLLAAVVGLAAAPIAAYAQSQPDYVLNVEVISGENAASTITADNRILGYTFSDSAAGIVGLYDGTSGGAHATTTYLFAETRVAAGASETVMFPYPKKLETGLYVVQASTGVLMVYYE